MKTRFLHRFSKPVLSKRNWVLNTDIDNQLLCLEKYKDEYFCIKHHLYCAACAPYHDFCDFEELEGLFNRDGVNAGDIVEIWVLSESPVRFEIKCPNENGLFPERGAY